MRRGRWATCESQRAVGWRYSGTEATPVMLPGEMERGSSSTQDIPPGEKHNRLLCDMGDIWGPSWLSLQREGQSFCFHCQCVRNRVLWVLAPRAGCLQLPKCDGECAAPVQQPTLDVVEDGVLGKWEMSYCQRREEGKRDYTNAWTTTWVQCVQNVTPYRKASCGAFFICCVRACKAPLNRYHVQVSTLLLFRSTDCCSHFHLKR